jgi:predicted nucleic acid-binding protein
LTVYYLDASALVKRYIREPGTSWIQSITTPSAQHSILLAEISLAEVAAAFAAKQRAARGISIVERNRALSLFLQDCVQSFLVLQTDRTVINLAIDLTQRHRLRGYDAVQLASALVNHRAIVSGGQSGLVLVASDADLLRAATGEGMATDNPVDHAGVGQTL